MRLKRLELHQFRCFDDETIEFAPSTVLIGPNNSGKSTILDALEYVLGTYAGDVQPRVRSMSEFFSSTTRVTAEFVDLNAEEKAAWGDLAPDGVATIARFVGAPPDGSVFVRMSSSDDGSPPTVETTTTSPGPFARVPLSLLDREAFASDQATLKDVSELWLDLRTDMVSQYTKSFDPSLPLPLLVRLRGPEHQPPTPEELLRPFVLAAARRAVERTDEAERILRALKDLAGSVVGQIEAGLARTIPRYLDPAYVEGADSPSIWSEVVLETEEALSEGGVLGDVVADLIAPYDMIVGNQSYETMGAGARRALLMAILELYLDFDLRPAEIDESIILALEEPEVGLHPAAQRRVARALRAMPTFGLQSIVATHSPTIVGAVRPEGIRLVRQLRSAGSDGELRHTVSMATGSEDIARAIGVTPADVLLGDRFVVTEGSSDSAILSTWALTLGVDLSASGVRLFDAGGYARTELIAKFLEVAYAGARFHVILDSGPDTNRLGAEMQARFGDRVSVTVLGRSEIEAYFSKAAITTWLTGQGQSTEDADEKVRDVLGDGVRKRLLKWIATELLGRDYEAVRDGVAIAARMTEREIPSEITGLVTALSQD